MSSLPDERVVAGLGVPGLLVSVARHVAAENSQALVLQESSEASNIAGFMFSKA